MRRRITRNAISAGLQVIVAGIVLFFLYRYLLGSLGVEVLGVWSIVTAATSTARIAQLGFSGAVVKYVSKYLVHKETTAIAEIVQTAAISSAGLVGAVLLLFYPVFTFLLGIVLPEYGVHEAFQVLPVVIIALWLSTISAVFLSGLDGAQRIDLRASIVTIGNGLYLFAAFILVPEYGLTGLAYSQLVQGMFVLLVGWASLRMVLHELPVLPLVWRRARFKEIFGYGVNFQLITLMQMLYEPTTKLLIGNFGGLAFTGYYEMASKMVLQLRTLLVAGNQVLVPVISGSSERGVGEEKDLFSKVYDLMFLVCAPFYTLIIVFAPIISQFWIGEYRSEFVISTYMLVLAWWINSLVGPAYFTYMGTGNLRWNVIGHVIIGLLNVCMGYALGMVIGGYGSVIGWVVALSLGSLFILVKYQRECGLPLAGLIPAKSVNLLLTSLVVIAFSIWFSLKYRVLVGPLEESGILLTVYCILVVPAIYFNPLVKMWFFQRRRA